MSDQKTPEDVTVERSGATAGVGAPRRLGGSDPLKLGRFGLLIVLVGMVAFFSILRPSTYFTWDNFISIATTQAVVAILALGVVLVLTVGEFDLSFAALFGICEVVVVGLMTRSGLSAIEACLVVLAGAAGVGALIAAMIVKLRVSSFIVTLGASTILGGLSVGYSSGSVVTGSLPPGFLDIGQHEVFGVPLPVIYVVVITAAVWLLLQFTSTGRRMAIVGGNRAAAQLTGVSIGRAIAAGFVGMGLLAAIAAIVTASMLESGQPQIASSYLLPAYAAAFLGATTITPGRFNAWGTLVGVLLLGAGTVGLQQVGLEPWVQNVFNGAVLVAAVAVSGYLTRRTSPGGGIGADSPI